MKEGNFETFKEMKECYCWEADDIKNEVDYSISTWANDLWKADHDDGNFFMWDDRSHIQIGSEDMPWREFKKLIFKDLK